MDRKPVQIARLWLIGSAAAALVSIALKCLGAAANHPVFTAAIPINGSTAPNLHVGGEPFVIAAAVSLTCAGLTYLKAIQVCPTTPRRSSLALLALAGLVVVFV